MDVGGGDPDEADSAYRAAVGSAMAARCAHVDAIAIIAPPDNTVASTAQIS